MTQQFDVFQEVLWDFNVATIVKSNGDDYSSNTHSNCEPSSLTMRSHATRLKLSASLRDQDSFGSKFCC